MYVYTYFFHVGPHETRILCCQDQTVLGTSATKCLTNRAMPLILFCKVGLDSEFLTQFIHTLSLMQAWYKV